MKGSSIVAYHERETIAHERGTIRDEWRIVRLHMERPEAEQRAIIDDCHRRKIDLSTAVAIEHRQLRFDGGPDFDREGAWTLLEVCRDDEHAIQSVDSWAGWRFSEDGISWTATAVDPRLVAQRQREEEAHEAKGIAAAEARAEREAQEREDEQRRQANAASEAAFIRLRDGSEAGRQLTEAWNAMAAAVNEERQRCQQGPALLAARGWLGRLEADAELVALSAAVMAATTVPAKRKAIKAALARVKKIAPEITAPAPAQKEQAA